MNLIRKLSQILFLLIFISLISLSHYNSNFIKNFIFIDENLLTIIYEFFSLHIIKFSLFLITVILFILIGRAFCGWICPLGTLFDILSKFFKHPKLRSDRTRAVNDTTSGVTPLRLKYNLLPFFFILLLFSIPIIWIFEPMTLSLKIFSTSILPVAKFSIYKTLEFLSKFPTTQNLAGNLFNSLNEYFVLDKINAYQTGILLTVLFITLVVLNYLYPRFWCRMLCPLGAILGIFSRLKIIKINISDSCVKCYKCVNACPMDAIISKNVILNPSLCHSEQSEESLSSKVNSVKNLENTSFPIILSEECNENLSFPRKRESNPPIILSEECTLCDRCRKICPTKAISYKLLKSTSQKNYYSPSRREFLVSLASGFLAIPILKFYQKEQKRPINFLRPPGACKEDKFISRCIKCGKCITACPTNGLQPSLFESGITGIWTPHLVPRIGSCQYNCNLCGKVCPTSAIKNLPLKKKKYTKIGTAIINRDLCWWWTGKAKCQICEEFCPYPDKAVKIITETKIINGKQVTKRGPIVKEKLCLGCGICENLCPVKETPAIYVINRDEKRL